MVKIMTKAGTHFVVVTGVTFIVFMTEALLHYNQGISESKRIPLTWSNFSIPTGKKLLHMAGIVILASTLSGWVIGKIEQQV